MDFSYGDILLVPLIMAISEGLKIAKFNDKYIPVVNVILGVIGGVVYLNPSDVKLGLLQGLVMGLTASGLYSSVKNVNEGIGGR